MNYTPDEIAEMVRTAVEAERERCARVCESFGGNGQGYIDDDWAQMCADAIRDGRAQQPTDADVWLFKGMDGAWHTFLNEQHRLDTIADGRWEVRKFYALSPAAVRRDVWELVTLAEQMERDAAGCRRDGYIDAAVVKEECAQRIRQTLGISAIAEALAAEGAQAGEVEDGPIDASDNAEYIEHCADRLERCGLPVTAGALRAIAHVHRALAQQPAAVDEAAAIRAFEEHIGSSSDVPCFEGELELWLTAWRKALAQQTKEIK